MLSMDPIERDDTTLILARQARLREVMRANDVPALLTADPINIAYACGARNMTVFSMMGPSRFVLVFAEGPTILFEFPGCEHLVDHLATVNEVRPAPGITPTSGPDYAAAAQRFAAEIAADCRRHLDASPVLGVERVDFTFTDALRAGGIDLRDATAVFSAARVIKLDVEIAAIRAAVVHVEDAVHDLERSIHCGATEVEVWASFHRALIAGDGEYVSTRLFQSGPNTFPYFREAGSRRIGAGELVCLDTDAIGQRGYAVDFSRTFRSDDTVPTPRQRELYALAFEQLQHNASLLRAGRSFEDVARRAWPVPERHQPWGYYCLGHGLGLCGEHPYLPHARHGEPYGLRGDLAAGMVICIESYIGDAAAGEGVKLEDQYLVTDTGAERLTTYPFDPVLGPGLEAR